MANVNQIMPFATGAQARVLDPAAYKVLAARVNGFVAGVADETQLNTVWRQSAFVAAMIAQFTVDRALVDVLDNGDISTFENNFTQAIAAIAASVIGPQNPLPIVQAAGAPFNYKTIQTTTRTYAQGNQAGVQVPVLVGMSYNKKSPTSNVVVVTNFTSYAPVIPGQGSAAAALRLASNAGPFADVGLNSAFNSANGSASGSGANTPSLVLTGLPAGGITLSLTYRRDDNLPWTTIFNPSLSDFGGAPSVSSSFFFIYEYEPSN